MICSHVSIYCLPNIRAPWVVVFEPHPWGHGALRVKEENALLIYQRAVSKYELEWLKDRVTNVCVTFKAPEDLLDYEDGQHEQVADVRDALDTYREKIALILKEVARKQAEKRRKEAKRRQPLQMVGVPKPEEEDDDEAIEEE